MALQQIIDNYQGVVFNSSSSSSSDDKIANLITKYELEYQSTVTRYQILEMENEATKAEISQIEQIATEANDTVEVLNKEIHHCESTILAYQKKLSSLMCVRNSKAQEAAELQSTLQSMTRRHVMTQETLTQLSQQMSKTKILLQNLSEDVEGDVIVVA